MRANSSKSPGNYKSVRARRANGGGGGVMDALEALIAAGIVKIIPVGYDDKQEREGAGDE